MTRPIGATSIAVVLVLLTAGCRPDDPEADIEAYCDHAPTYQRAHDLLVDTMTSDVVPGDIEDILDAVMDETQAMADLAPQELDDEWAGLAEARQAFIDAWRAHDFDDAFRTTPSQHPSFDPSAGELTDIIVSRTNELCGEATLNACGRHSTGSNSDYCLDPANNPTPD